MTRLVARLLLAMLQFPITAAIVLVVLIGFVARGPQPIFWEITLMWLVIYPLIATYWILIWKDVIRWTARRVVGTLLAGPFALAISALVGLALLPGVGLRDAFIIFLVAGGLVPILWVLATVVIWRETPSERMERIAAAGTETISCPVCGYNLTGLREARCPECGSPFTFDQLLAGQPKRDPSTLDDE
jgi:hypothetical protein